MLEPFSFQISKSIFLELIMLYLKQQRKPIEMQKEYQNSIKVDQQDLSKLTVQVEKVERLKKQYHQQKEQIGSLKSTILELQSENEELKSRGKSQDLQKKQKYSGQSIQREKDRIRCPQQLCRNKKSVNKFVDEVSSEQPNPFEIKTYTKIRNQHIGRINRKSESNNFTRFDELKRTKEYPQPSLRNHSGFISSTRKFLSPPLYTRRDTWCLKEDYDNSSYSSQEDELRIDLQHMQTKKHLYDNLIADLKMEIENRDRKIVEDRTNLKKTKKQLKKQRQQKLNYQQSNKRIKTNYQILERQNYYLKQELIKQTQNKIRWENLNNDLVLWYNTAAKRIYEDFQLQFMAMDNIYYEFERVHAQTTSHLGR